MSLMDSPIRVLQVMPGGSTQGGIEAFVLNYYRNINRHAVQFDFLVHYSSEKWFCEDEINDLGGRVYYTSVREDKNFLAYIRKLHGVYSKYGGYRIIHGHMPGFAPLYFSVADKDGIPIRISHCHVTATEPTAKGFLLDKVIRIIPRTTNVHWACSEMAGEYMYGKGSSFDVIPNAIDLRRFKPDSAVRERMRKELGITGRFVVGCVGRICRQKNQMFLLDVFKALLSVKSNAVLLLIGDGDMADAVRRKVIELGMSESVLIRPTQQNVEDYYRAMDVYVVPSIFEGLCIAAIEAQACGLPCVLSAGLSVGTIATPWAEMLDLKETAQTWATMLAKVGSAVHRDAPSYVAAAGFDIRTCAKALEDRYLLLHERANGTIA